jgi:hypothetical protein
MIPQVIELCNIVYVSVSFEFTKYLIGPQFLS